MDDTTLMLVAIFWLVMLGFAYLIAQSRRRSTLRQREQADPGSRLR